MAGRPGAGGLLRDGLMNPSAAGTVAPVAGGGGDITPADCSLLDYLFAARHLVTRYSSEY